MKKTDDFWDGVKFASTIFAVMLFLAGVSDTATRTQFFLGFMLFPGVIVFWVWYLAKGVHDNDQGPRETS